MLGGGPPLPLPLPVPGSFLLPQLAIRASPTRTPRTVERIIARTLSSRQRSLGQLRRASRDHATSSTDVFAPRRRCHSAMVACMGVVRASLVAVVCFMGIAGCTRRNPNACCTTQADCDEVGLTFGTECAAGLACINNGCVDLACEADSDCLAPTPFCTSEHVCVECDDSSHCGSGACDSATHACVECLDNAQCTSGVCDQTAQKCVECLDSAQCPAGACNATTQTCVECLGDAQCANGVCDTAAQMCVQCLDNSQCLTGACNTSTHTCVNCNDNTQCTSGACDTTTHTCLECSTNAQCGAQVCGPTECVACSADAQCASGLCDAATGLCLTASAVVPKFAPQVCQTLSSTPSLDVNVSVTLSTTDIATCSGGVIVQTSGPEICVIHVGRLSISALATLKVTGSRAIALVADRAITLAGTLDLDATQTTNGPGGGTAVVGGPLGVDGGGGAGFRTAGGHGGNATGGGGAGNRLVQLFLIPLAEMSSSAAPRQHALAVAVLRC